MICVVVCTNVVDLVLVIVAFFVCVCFCLRRRRCCSCRCPRASVIVDVVDVVA